MEVIAKTNDGLLIHASANEIKEIITSVSGIRPEEIKIGQKIPAIDYASTITKIKALKNEYHFKQLLSESEKFIGTIDQLKKAVNEAENLNI